MRRLDIIGERYGKLIAIERLRTTGRSRWLLKCDCGNETTAELGNVRSGQVTSCGCMGSRATIGERSLKHGHSVGFKKSRTAAAWRNAKTRCFNEANAKYPSYGGRGITMSPAWANDFRAFLRDMGECPDGLTLERVEVDGNYEPGNCKWLPKPDQAKNKRSTIRVGASDLKDFAVKMGISYKMLHRRVRKLGETPKQAADWLLAKSQRKSRLGS